MRLAAFSIATVAFIGAAVGSASADMPVERGSYLVNTILTCGNCHSPKGPPQAIAGKDFSGGLRFDEPPFDVTASNITPDKETGIGAWSDAEIRRAITQGIDKDGNKLKPPMGFGYYAHMTDADLDAVIAWVRLLPAKE